MKEKLVVNLPFDFEKGVYILQGFHGPWSHKEFSPTKDLSYAVDFILPLGTPVAAAKEGKVILGFDRSKKYYGGSDPEIGNALVWGETNYLLIEHSDGTISLYSHLAKDSIVVERGQGIKAGQIIAKTGLSGWVGPTPHLHFQIYGKGDFKSVPFSLHGYSKSLEHSELGE